MGCNLFSFMISCLVKEIMIVLAKDFIAYLMVLPGFKTPFIIYDSNIIFHVLDTSLPWNIINFQPNIYINFFFCFIPGFKTPFIIYDSKIIFHVLDTSLPW